MIKYGLNIFQVPQDTNTLLWTLAVGGAGVIGYLFITLQKQRKEYEQRIDELNKRLLDDKDKAVEQYIESTQKTLITINTLVDRFNDIPREVAEKMVLQCKSNLESVLTKKSNE